MTFDTKGEIIVGVEWIAVARNLDVVLALIRTYLSFILRKLPSAHFGILERG